MWLPFASFCQNNGRACQIVSADRKMIRYRSCRPPETALRAKLRDLANERRRFGDRRLFILLRREGEPSGVNRIYRLYREKGPSVGRRRAMRRAVGTHAPILVEAKANAHWSLDFVHDRFACGRRFRVLNVVDDVTRECLAAHINLGTSRCPRTDSAHRTTRQARHDRFRQWHGTHLEYDPRLVEGPQGQVALYRAGKAYVRQGYAESFNGRMRDELLNESLFLGLDHARSAIAEWADDYNNFRPNPSLGDQTPAVYAGTIAATGSNAAQDESYTCPPVATTPPFWRNRKRRTSCRSRMKVQRRVNGAVAWIFGNQRFFACIQTLVRSQPANMAPEFRQVMIYGAPKPDDGF